MKAWLATRWGRRAIGLGAWLAALAGLAVALAWLVPLPARLGTPPSVVMEWRDGGVAYVFVAPDGRWRPEVRPEELDPAYLRALLRLEDRRFSAHPGVDPVAIIRAAATNLQRGRRVSGASTLTMQLVRMLEPRPRTFASKAIEALRALQLELRLSKRQILAAYLQYLPFGGGVEGVEAASLTWFGHRPTTLSATEVATLLAVPQDPNHRAPGPGHDRALRTARDEVAGRLAALAALPRGHGPVASDATVLAEIAATPVPALARPFPREAPHAAAWLRAANPSATRLRSTLDAGIQRVAQRLVAAAEPDLRRQGIQNGAVVVTDPGSGQVRALIGNLDFWEAEHGGQISAFDVPRSPGSTLKPFIYAAAIEKGLAGPRTLVPDVPTSFGGYTPRNFEGKHDGLVALEDALAHSLNIPFVSLLRDLGVEPFLGRLRAMGVRSLDARPGHYGLSVAVGGLELTPLELAGLYTTLARGGEWVETRVTVGGEAPAHGKRLEPGSTWLVGQALALRDRPDFPARRALTGAPAQLHWKTGTSFGHRDAWAAGWSRNLAAVVWLGNLDGTASRQLVGGEVAAPILFDLLEALAERGGAAPVDAPPTDVTWTEVCALSGRVATPACGQRRLVPALRSAVPTERCQLHRTLLVDIATGQALAPGCREGRRYEERTFVTWPAGVRRWLRDQDRALPEPPPLAPGCARGGVRHAPVIISPAAGQVALLAPGVPAERQEVVLEAEGAAGGSLSWFVDGLFLGRVGADDRFWWRPNLGTHELLVVDDAGLSARRTLEVRARGR